MDRINGRIAQVYGYAVCLICVIVILVSTHTVIDAAFDYGNPMWATAYGGSGPYSTYESWRMEFEGRRASRPNGVVPRDTSLTDKDMRRIYESERANQLESTRFRALRSLISGIVFLVLATTMFLLHWRWIRRSNAESVPA